MKCLFLLIVVPFVWKPQINDLGADLKERASFSFYSETFVCQQYLLFCNIDLSGKKGINFKLSLSSLSNERNFAEYKTENKFL